MYVELILKDGSVVLINLTQMMGTRYVGTTVDGAYYSIDADEVRNMKVSEKANEQGVEYG